MDYRPGTVVAILKTPLPLIAIENLANALQATYGEDLHLHLGDGEVIITTPPARK